MLQRRGGVAEHREESNVLGSRTDRMGDEARHSHCLLLLAVRFDPVGRRNNYSDAG